MVVVVVCTTPRTADTHSTRTAQQLAKAGGWPRQQAPGAGIEADMAAAQQLVPPFEAERHATAVRAWPPHGRVILAQFTDEAVLVYAAFDADIVRWAVAHQTFKGAEAQTGW